MVGSMPRFLRLDELRYASFSGPAGCTSFSHNSKEQQRGSGVRGGKTLRPALPPSPIDLRYAAVNRGDPNAVISN